MSSAPAGCRPRPPWPQRHHDTRCGLRVATGHVRESTGVKRVATTGHTVAKQWFRRSANQGCARAHSQLGDMYFFGSEGVAKDYAEAVKWLRSAADLGVASAQFRLGTCLNNGRGCEMTPTAATSPRQSGPNCAPRPSNPLFWGGRFSGKKSCSFLLQNYQQPE